MTFTVPHRPVISPCNGSLFAVNTKQVQVSTTVAVSSTRFTKSITSHHTQTQSQRLVLGSPRSPLAGVLSGLLDEEVLDNELKMLVERLERAVERIRVIEVEKFTSRTKGTISNVDKHEAEMMSIKIIDGFLDRPIQYLRRKGNGSYACKLMDLRILVEVIEGSSSSSCKDQFRCNRT